MTTKNFLIKKRKKKGFLVQNTKNMVGYEPINFVYKLVNIKKRVCLF